MLTHHQKVKTSITELDILVVPPFLTDNVLSADHRIVKKVLEIWRNGNSYLDYFDKKSSFNVFAKKCLINE